MVWCAVASLAATALVGLAAGPATHSAPAAERWESLFNGRDLEGWTPKFAGHPLGTNYLNTFRVENGLLKVCYANHTNFNGRFGHLFWRERLGNYVLRVEYRFVGRQVAGGPGWAYRNSGVMIHGEDPAGMTLDQDFPTSIEVQLLGGGGQGERSTANLCTPGTLVVMDGQIVRQHCVNSTSKTYHGDQWVTVEIEVRGSRLVRHIVQGETVLSYTLPQLDEGDARARSLIRDGKTILEGGTISLQAESHPVEFRRVELRRLGD